MLELSNRDMKSSSKINTEIPLNSIVQSSSKNRRENNILGNSGRGQIITGIE